ncbi:chromodomain-helicase-DNA-binding protein 7 [Lates japonicus]|uniref:Chromodomain-helicase-DNA-binding protein 7 n=1 Tax=Lates japonicus TaxID=270547 RepID=A0AAD3NIU7_LATJO|nr:chromodomain-helicase-DNA-binding protein 7 [Lates japonicus]
MLYPIHRELPKPLCLPLTLNTSSPTTCPPMQGRCILAWGRSVVHKWVQIGLSSSNNKSLDICTMMEFDDAVTLELMTSRSSSQPGGGDQRLLQAQQQASRGGQPLQSAPMGFQGPAVSQHGAPASNQGLAPPTQNAQTQHTHLPPQHLQSTPPQSNQGSNPWAPTPLVSHPLSSPPLTPQKVPHMQHRKGVLCVPHDALVRKSHTHPKLASQS